MSRKVKSVSFLKGEHREIVEADSRTGKFLLKYNVYGKYGSTRLVSRSYNLYRFVTHEQVKDCDPVLTLESGDKIRVYHGGDQTQMLAQAAGLIERHDKTQTLRKSLLEKVKKNSLKEGQDVEERRESFAYNLDFVFDDDDYDGIF